MAGIFGSYLEGKQLAADRKASEKQAQLAQMKIDEYNDPAARRARMYQMMNLEDQGRQNAMISDAKRIKTLVANNDLQGAMSFASDRAQAIQELGGDARETFEIYNAMRAGQPEQAMQMIDNFLAIAEGRPEPEAKVGRFRTERIGDELIMYDSATSQQVKSWKIPQTKKEQLELKKTVQQIEKAESENQIKALTAESEEGKRQASIDMALEAASLATELANDPNLGQAVGTVSTWIPTVRETTQDVINKAQRLESLLTVDNLKLMTGVLTDRDIAFLTRVASGINITDNGIKGSESAVKNRLNEIAKKIQSSVTTSQTAQPQGQQQNNTPIGTVSWDEL